MFSFKTIMRWLILVTVLVPFTLTAAVLEISVDPDNPSPPVLKPGEQLHLLITDNAPKEHKLTNVTVENGTPSGCQENTVIKAGEQCELTIEASSFGRIMVTVSALDGKIVSASLEDDFVVAIRFAAYNLSFDRGSYDELLAQMALTRNEQQTLIDKFHDNQTMTEAETELARAAIQIRNVAEVIQRTEPDVFVLAEFNNDGEGEDETALNDFKKNYLAHAQHESVRGIPYDPEGDGDTYKYIKNVPTNTGLMSGHDLDRDGEVDGGPDDAWGFGFYHGQYAFAVFSKYPFDDSQYRTFQNFLWKDMDGEENIKIDQCGQELPDNLECGDPWYTEEAWNEMPLSSKNHIDLPIDLSSIGVSQPIHLLVSHPAPPISDNAARHNTKRNRAEVDFWNDYIAGKDYFKDDDGKTGGLAPGAYFVVAGDLNADPDFGDGILEPIQNLLASPLVNTLATTGTLRPTSNGAQEHLNSSDCYRSCDRNINNETMTAVSALRIDYAIPSINLRVLRSGVFWPASGEEGRHLVSDPVLGASKEVSSDHRMVWVDLYPVISP